MPDQKFARWSRVETDRLLELLGDVPMHILTARYRQWASRMGHPERSPKAIEQRIRRLKGRRTPVGTYITSGTIVGLLGISYTTLDRWVERGFLAAERSPTYDRRAKRVRPPRRLFLRASVVQMALDYPERLAGTSRENLYMLLEDEQLADSISKKYPHRKGRDPVPVVCIETGQKYPSIAAAARANYVTRNCLYESIHRGTRANRRHWRYADPSNTYTTRCTPTPTTTQPSLLPGSSSTIRPSSAQSSSGVTMSPPAHGAELLVLSA